MSNEQTVRALYDAFRERRRDDAEALIAADFTFISPYDDAIDRIAADSAGAFVTYSATTKERASFRNTEYLTVRNGQVAGANVYFGANYRDGVFIAQPIG